MNHYPFDIENKLEVQQVRQIISGFCSTEAAKLKVLHAKPQYETERLRTYLQQTLECISIRNESDQPVFQFEDALMVLSQIRTEGTFLTGEELLILKNALSTTYSWTQFLKRNKDQFPALFNMILGFISSMDLAREIQSKIDDRGEVRSKATPDLAEIRKDIIKAESRVRSSIKRVLEKVKKENYCDPTSEITVREGRLVIPVWAEHKRHISGFVHDESSTGQTVFMEPSEVLELNNNVRELLYQEKREVRKILTHLADKVRDQLNDIEKGRSFLILMDFINAKAQFAVEFQGSIPTIHDKPVIKLVDGFHPLLKKLNDDQGKETIPLNLELDSKQHRVCVISGPNAGGKSVAMKTVGLLQFLLQCGFPITADESSEFGVFSKLFVDIGDSQSLENDLSTYSSRLTAMKYFIEKADQRTLVLIDEFGTGTEPQFGGAIAEAILEKMAKTGTFGVITTHYANIKDFAERTKGLVNGAMRYDTGKLEPLYQLSVGKPGSSFALEIARKIGLSDEILNKAKKSIGADHVKFERLLTDLENDKVKLEQQKKTNDKNQEEVLKIREDYEALKKMLETDRKKILREAKEEAKRIVTNANKEIEKVIREIKESKADKQRTSKARKGLDSLREELHKTGKTASPKKKKTIEKLEVGDHVMVSGQEGVGEILEIKKKQAFVSFGLLKSHIYLDRLNKVSKAESRRVARSGKSGVKMDKNASFTTELDVRGRRAEEVIGLVDKFIDDALLLGTNQLRILHGKGYGVLREVIRTHLHQDPNVVGISDEHEEHGGSGVTMVTLK